MPIWDGVVYSAGNNRCSRGRPLKLPSLRLYRHFLDGAPFYLIRHYWWAYLWPPGVRFFDRQPIINVILFGQYKKLMAATLATLARLQSATNTTNRRVLQLSCVYGELTPKLMAAIAPAPLHITDVAAIQLKLAQSKASGDTLLAARMNAEQLAHKDDSFSTVVVFFLLHEMPPSARNNVLCECMRVIPAGGVLLVTEYAPLPTHHMLYRFPPSRWLLTRLDPFLDGFWREDMAALLNRHGQPHSKKAITRSDERFFSGFYRVTEFQIAALGP